MYLALLFCVAAAAIDANAPDPNAVTVECATTKGNFTLVINPSWAPLGAARFLEMVDKNFFAPRNAAYRVVPGFLAQFGIPWMPTNAWPDIQDDPNVGIQYPVFKRGMIAFAGYAPNTRGTEVFIGYEDSTSLGRTAWGNPFGIVTQGMSTVDNFYSGYGDLTQFGGHAPDPTTMTNTGCQFLLSQFPNLDYITSCSRIRSSPSAFASPSAASPAAPASLPSCSAQFCGKGIGFGGPNAVCLCHQNCMAPGSSLPCCLGMQQACPTQYAAGLPLQPAQQQTTTAGKAGKGKKAKGKVRVLGKRLVTPATQTTSSIEG